MIYYVLLYLAVEAVGVLAFKYFGETYGAKNQNQTTSKRPFWNGIMERLFLHIALIAGFGHALTLFGALKIATRIKQDENKITNDYFLIGNLISVSMVIITLSVWKYFFINE